MFTMYDLGKDNLWAVETRSKTFSDSFKSVVLYCVKELGANPDEIELGVLEMNKNDHDAIEFGINKFFIYTFKKGEKDGKIKSLRNS